MTRAAPPRVPTYPLEVLAPAAGPACGVFLLDRRIDPRTPFRVPYRSEYYGVGICLTGRARVSADLQDYVLAPGRVLAMPPQAIKQWDSMAKDFEHIVVFFTRAFVAERNAFDPDRFSYFESGLNLLTLKADTAAAVLSVFRQVQAHYAQSHVYRDETLRALIQVLLYDLEAAQLQPTARRLMNDTRGSQLTAAFRQLVRRHVVRERRVSFYAQALHVTPRHLSTTVRTLTGKTAGDWIHETAALEARVLLQDQTLNIGQVADALHFPDASSFGKFFKKLAGVSPQAYRASCPAHPTF